MIRRILLSTGTLAAVGAMLVSTQIVSSQTPPASGAKAASKAATYTAPRTPWGDPDLQGSWTTDDVIGIPLQRAQNFGDRLYLTDEEFATRAKADEQNRKNNANRPTAVCRRSRPKRSSGAHRATAAPMATVPSTAPRTSRCTTAA